MRKLIRFLIGLMACCVLGYSLYQMWFFGSQESESHKLNDSLADSVVTLREPAPKKEKTPEPTGEGETEATEPIRYAEPAPITVDFAQLFQQSEDVIGWLYCEGTPINLPVAQAEDNQFYLKRLLNGAHNNLGTLFADYRNSEDLSDWNTVIYGHNMRSGAMFGTLKNYVSQEYFELHPNLWLLTPQGDYKVELIAGFVTSSGSEFYDNPENPEAAMDLARKAMEQSTFESDLTLDENDRYLTLSTCSYEFQNARYVIVGRLIPCEPQ